MRKWEISNREGEQDKQAGVKTRETAHLEQIETRVRREKEKDGLERRKREEDIEA